MRQAYIKNRSGGLDAIMAYEVNDFPYDKLIVRQWLNTGKKVVKAYNNTFATFDIETSTIEYERDAKGKYIQSPRGFMYHWQMCVGGYPVFGRTWETWIEFMHKLVDTFRINDRYRLVIYDHNLGYEFQFMKDFLRSEFGDYTQFSAQPRKPMKVSTGCGFEFRCSWKLTNMSLAKFLENEKGVRHIKAKDDLDYDVVRTAETPLTDEEFGYCISDVVGLYEGIQCRLANEGDNLCTIPLTSTGYVRRDCRNASRKANKWHEQFKKLYLTPETFNILDEAKRGGDTHANRLMAGRVWHDVDSYDFQSSYPAMMMLKKFPSSRFAVYGYVESIEELEGLFEKYHCIFRAGFHDLECRSKTIMPYVPYSKLLGKVGDFTNDNGRILDCPYVVLTITEIDWQIIKEQYTWSSVDLSPIWYAKSDYLPEWLRECVMKFFRDKTTLKGEKKKASEPEVVENLEYLYAKSKNRLNGIFGMCLTSPIHPEIVETDGVWSEVAPNIEDALEHYNNSRNSFLYYAWGVYITAHARYHLYQLVKASGNGVIYCDTDSSKATQADHAAIAELNKSIMAECEKLGAYCDYDGERYYLGIAEHETKVPMKNFKTLGAKKYCDTSADGKFEITIAGVNKKKGAIEMGSIDNFKLGFIFTEAGGQTLYYNQEPIGTIEVNGCTMTTASNVGMVDSTYELGVTNEYFDLISTGTIDII